MEELMALQQAPEFAVIPPGTTRMCRWEYVNSTVGYGYVEIPEKEKREMLARLTEQVQEIYSLGRDIRKSFFGIGCALRKLKRNRDYTCICCKSEQYSDFYDFVYKVFGFKRTTADNLMRVHELCFYGFNLDTEPKFDTKYEGYSYSQLVELAALSPSEVAIFTPDVTVAEIKEIRRGWKNYGRLSLTGVDWRDELARIRKSDAAAAEKAVSAAQEGNGFLAMFEEKRVEENEFPEEQTAPPVAAAAETAAESVEVAVKEKPVFANRKERSEWLKNFRDWGVWKDAPWIDMTFYRHDFGDGFAMIVAVGVNYTLDARTGKYDNEWEDVSYHPLDKENPKFAVRGKTLNQAVDWMTEHAAEL